MFTDATALFCNRHAVRAAVEQLVQSGFTRDAISVVMSERTHEREFGDRSSDRSGVRFVPLAGVLQAILSGLVAVPSRGGLALRAAGPLAAALRRASEDATPTTLSSALSNGLANHDARVLNDGMRGGAIVIGVQAIGDRLRLATRLLQLAGGVAVQAA